MCFPKQKISYKENSNRLLMNTSQDTRLYRKNLTVLVCTVNEGMGGSFIV